MIAAAFAQQPYKLPFASTGNSIELAVVNKSEQEAKEITVEAVDKPEWLKYDVSKKIITQIKSLEEQPVTFNFSVEKEAPVNKEITLRFKIESKTGEIWHKEITIAVNPPDKFELYQNYPNPFNPTTNISYVIPNPSFVIIKVFDVLGKEAATLVNEMEEAGYHKVVWNAQSSTSGMYIYQARIKTQQGNETVVRKKMLMVK